MWLCVGHTLAFVSHCMELLLRLCALQSPTMSSLRLDNSWVLLLEGGATWKLPFGVKKKLFGEHRVAVGGNIPGAEVPEHDLPPLSSEAFGEDVMEDSLSGIDKLQFQTGRGPSHVRTDESEEVVFFHAWPTQLYRELIHSYSAVALIDLTAGAGNAARAAMQMNTLYCGVCLTDVHRNLLQQRMQRWAWQELRNPEALNRRMFNARLTKQVVPQVEAGGPVQKSPASASAVPDPTAKRRKVSAKVVTRPLKVPPVGGLSGWDPDTAEPSADNQQPHSPLADSPESDA